MTFMITMKWRCIKMITICITEKPNFILTEELLDWTDRTIKKKWMFYTKEIVKKEIQNDADHKGQKIEWIERKEI